MRVEFLLILTVSDTTNKFIYGDTRSKEVKMHSTAIKYLLQGILGTRYLVASIQQRTYRSYLKILVATAQSHLNNSLKI